MAAYPPPSPCRPSLDVNGSNCLQLLLSGSGAPLDPYIISGNLNLGGTVKCAPTGLEVKISSDLKNSLSVGQDGGLYSSMPIFGDDSGVCGIPNGCIDITMNGDGTECSPFIISGQLVISPVCDLVSCTPDGLCVTPTQLRAENTACIQLMLTGDGSLECPYLLKASPIINPAGSGLLSCGPNGLNVAPTFFMAQDTNTVNHTLLGEGTSFNPYILSSKVNIDPRVGNLIHESPSGLYVECNEIAGCLSLNVVDTNSINMDLVGTGTLSNPWVISSVVKVSGNPNNVLQVAPDGLLITCDDIGDCISISVTDTNTANMTLTTTGNTHNIKTDVKISTTAGNILTANATGLYVPAADSVGVADTNTVDMTLSGSGIISGVVRISGAAGNDISVNGDGLYVNLCDTQIVSVGDSASGTMGPFSAGTYTLGTTGPVSLTVPNSRECAMKILRNWGIAADVPLNSNVRANVWIDFNINGAGFVPFLFCSSNLDPTSRTEAIQQNQTEVQTQHLPPGSTVTIDTRVRLEIIGGSMSAMGTWIVGMSLIPVGA